MTHSSMIIAGSSSEEFAKGIANHLHIPLVKVKIESFPDGETGLQILESVRGKDLFVVQTLARRPNQLLMELFVLVDALKRASARSITAVLPYFAYARQDRKEKGRVPITARLIANLLERAGVDRVLTMDLHTEQIQGFFDVPVDHLYARPLFVKALLNLGLQNPVIVSPDVGRVRMARRFAEEMGADVAFVDKRRLPNGRVEGRKVVGDVAGREVVLVDDICVTGKTLQEAVRVCVEEGAKKIVAVVTHGLSAHEIELKGVDTIFVSNSIPQPEKREKVHVIRAEPLFAEAIDCVMRAKSISSLFKS